MPDTKTVLLDYLRAARASLLWKLDGLSEYDARRPLVRTGTNLLGLVKHTASVEAGYLGAVFGRPFPDEPFPWFADDAEANADMWATADESRADLVDLHHRVAAHSDATVAARSLESTGRVPWWPEERATVTLGRVLVHVTTETHRHAGQADIVRELVDGRVGMQPDDGNVPDVDDDWWQRHRARLEQVARSVDERPRHG